MAEPEWLKEPPPWAFMDLPDDSAMSFRLRDKDRIVATTEYPEDFYKQYEEYLHEKSVRDAHDWVFSIVKSEYFKMLDDRLLTGFFCFDNVIDFGCGIFNEYLQFAKPKRYLGIDLNAVPPHICADYRTYDLSSIDFCPSAFVSLFSIENTASFKDNYQFYEKIFKTFSSIKYGLSSGFFYSGNKNEIVKEAAGVKSYQTLANIDVVQSSVFSEKRIILPVPSKMFGPDVFEVWKLFEKKVDF